MNENWLGLDGQVVIVTGGASGIGKHVVDTLVKVGANAVAVDLNVKTGDELDGAYCVQCNVTDPESVNQMVQAVLEKYGKIDALVNNAGITRDTLLLRMKENQWDEVLDTDLKAVFLTTKAASSMMVRKKSGAIINISSVVGITGNPGQANYAAAKAGVIGFTKSAAKELAGRGIRVNVVAPGFVETDMTDVIPENIKEGMLETIPLKRAGRAEDIANAVAFLASDESAYITGQVLQVDGGMVM